MTYRYLISTGDLANHLDDRDWLIADCRFMLSRPDEMREHYLRAHIPGATYFHLDHDLSAPIIPGITGRHPLPPLDEIADRFGKLGIGPGVQVAAYDDQGGSLSAVRLWWMLRLVGHDSVAVVDGGWQKWLDEGRLVRSGNEQAEPRSFIPKTQSGLLVTTEEVDRLRRDSNYLLLDVRTAERYRGETEPIDPVAGHIPGALNAPYADNLTPDGVFRSTAELRSHYTALIGETPPENVIFYCGSGVTSIHSVLAMELAGFSGAKLYLGSWSEWIASGERPIAVGPDQG